MAAPANKGDSMVLDMATTAVALGKIELNDRKGLDIPVGWGVDASGKVRAGHGWGCGGCRHGWGVWWVHMAGWCGGCTWLGGVVAAHGWVM